MNKVTKAIIPVAGWGTRRLPVTRALEKCMMPIGNRPVIDYVVQDLVMAGITDIYFVVNQGDDQLEKFYTRNQRLEEYLQRSGKPEYLRYCALPQNVNFYYIEQDSVGKYGTAIPVGLCAPYVKPGESVAVAMGDGFIYREDNASQTAHLMTQTPENGCSILGLNIPREAVSRYGVIEFDDQGRYMHIVEKPAPEAAPSTLMNVGMYILNYDLLQAVAAYANVDITGEYQILEPFHQYTISGGAMTVVQAEGEYLDAGDVYTWLYANQRILGQI